VNVRFLISLIVAGLLLSAAWYGVNHWQVRRHAENLLSLANVAEEQKRPDRAARFIGLYVGLMPGNVDARVRYGLLLDRLAASQQRPADSRRGKEGALAVFEQVLIRDPGRDDIRRRAASLAVELEHFDDAHRYMTFWGDNLPKDGEILELLGRAYEGRGEYVKAAKKFETAVAAAPERVEAYLHLARLQRDRLGQAMEAKATLDKLVENNSKSYQAYLGRARFLQEGKALDLAQSAMDKALELKPDDPEVLLAAAELAARRPDGLEKAREHLLRAEELHPHLVQAYEDLARIELAARRKEEAVAVLRRGLKKLPDQPDLTWNLTNLLIQSGQPDEAEELLKRLEKADLPRPRMQYLRAALRLRRGDWAAARKELEAVRPLVTDSRELTIQCDLLIADCCEQAGERETEVLICRRAIALDPQKFGARLRLVVTLQRLGRLEEALDECHRMMALPSPPPDGSALLAQLMIQQNLRLPDRKEQWQEVDLRLKEADKAARTDEQREQLALLRAENLMAQKKFADAHKELKEARAKLPRQEGLWLASVDLAVRDGKRELAERILADAEKKLGDGAGLRLSRLRFLLAYAGAEKELRDLEAGLDKFAKEDQGRVLAALAEVHLQAGRTAEARRLWDKVAELLDRDLDSRLRSFDLALQGEDEADVVEALDKVRKLEGEGGTFGLYNDARRLLWLASRGELGAELKRGLAKARDELEVVSKRRPGWSRVALCLGQAWDLEGRPELALEHYKRAVDQGERQFDLIHRVVRLLYDRSRFTEAEGVLQRLPEQAPVLADTQRDAKQGDKQRLVDMQQLVAEVSLRTGNYARARDAARKAVKKDSSNPREWVWLGQVLWLTAQQPGVTAGQRLRDEAEAEEALHKAVELAPDGPEVWVALVQHLVRTRRTDEAEATLEKARKQLPAEQASLALAQCYAALNKPDKAREQFDLAVKARPDDPAVLRIAADFYVFINELKAAEQCLRKVLDGRKADQAAAATARLTLAMVLAAQGGDQLTKEALALVGKPPEGDRGAESGIDSAQRERAEAVVLALMPQRSEQREAIKILEHLSTQQLLTLEDRFLLVQVYERIGNYPTARERMQPLRKSGSAHYLSWYVNFLLRHGKAARPGAWLDEAEQWLADLEKLEPDKLRTDLLKALLLKAQGRAKEAAPLLSRHADKKDATAADVLRVALLLEQAGCGADAVRHYRRYVEMDKKPEAVLYLAACLARQKQLGEALDLCDSAWKSCPPGLVARTTLDILSESHPDNRQLDRFEGRLKEAVDKDQKSNDLLLFLGSLYELRGRYEEAVTLYRQVLERDSRNAVALNNVAWILAMQDGKGEEALVWVNKAIEVLGPIPELLDTRAVAFLVAGRTDSALEDLLEAVGRPNLDPKVRFSITVHLARVYKQAGRTVEAKKRWREAHSDGPGPEGLHGLERPGYEKLAAELGPR
jgi:tetratricopeptide (TPR) repeat protein